MENQESIAMGRRKFIGAAAAALFAGVAITITGCGEDDVAGPGDGGKTGIVEEAASHKHSVSITKAELDAGGQVTLTLTGGSHTHELKLTAAEVATIKANGHLTKSSEPFDSHSHSVHFM